MAARVALVVGGGGKAQRFRGGGSYTVLDSPYATSNTFGACGLGPSMGDRLRENMGSWHFYGRLETSRHPSEKEESLTR